MTAPVLESEHPTFGPHGLPPSPAIPDMSLPDYVLGGASARGSKIALVEALSGRSLTYAALAAAVRRVGTGLANSGVGATDVVALCAPNGIDFVVGWYAASSIGAVVTTVNPLSTREEIIHHLRRSGASWLITTDELHAEKAGAAAEPGSTAWVWVRAAHSVRWGGLSDLLSRAFPGCSGQPEPCRGGHPDGEGSGGRRAGPVGGRVRR